MIDKLLLLQKELINLKDNDKIIITAPRRSGKTTLLRNVIANYSRFNQGVIKNNISVFAPQKQFGDNLGTNIITTFNQYRGIDPKLVIVEEAAYCNDQLLEEMDSVLHCPKIFITTPKSVEYIWVDLYNDWKCTTYVKEMIDQDLARVFSFHFKDFDKETQNILNKEKRLWIRKQWQCEINGMWIE